MNPHYSFDRFASDEPFQAPLIKLVGVLWCLEMALQGMVLGLMVLYVHASLPVRAGLVALVILIWLAFFGFCERSFRRSNSEEKLKY